MPSKKARLALVRAGKRGSRAARGLALTSLKEGDRIQYQFETDGVTSFYAGTVTRVLREPAKWRGWIDVDFDSASRWATREQAKLARTRTFCVLCRPCDEGGVWKRGDPARPQPPPGSECAEAKDDGTAAPPAHRGDPASLRKGARIEYLFSMDDGSQKFFEARARPSRSHPTWAHHTTRRA